jgi:hypothetical protein
MKNSIVLTYNKNFIQYIGYGGNATHTKKKERSYSLETVSQKELDDKNFKFPIQRIDRAAERYFTKNRKVSTIIRAKLKIRSRWIYKLIQSHSM